MSGGLEMENLSSPLGYGGRYPGFQNFIRM